MEVVYLVLTVFAIIVSIVLLVSARIIYYINRHSIATNNDDQTPTLSVICSNCKHTNHIHEFQYICSQCNQQQSILGSPLQLSTMQQNNLTPSNLVTLEHDPIIHVNYSIRNNTLTTINSNNKDSINPIKTTASDSEDCPTDEEFILDREFYGERRAVIDESVNRSNNRPRSLAFNSNKVLDDEETVSFEVEAVDVEMQLH
jgi:hypothetical protein